MTVVVHNILEGTFNLTSAFMSDINSMKGADHNL